MSRLFFHVYSPASHDLWHSLNEGLFYDFKLSLHPCHKASHKPSTAHDVITGLQNVLFIFNWQIQIFNIICCMYLDNFYYCKNYFRSSELPFWTQLNIIYHTNIIKM